MNTGTGNSYYLSGLSARDRIQPLLLPPHLPEGYFQREMVSLVAPPIPKAPYFDSPDEGTENATLDNPGPVLTAFIWQNTPTRNARELRNRALVYNHLSMVDGTCLLDDKWSLALLQQRMECPTLKSYCLKGRSEFERWSERHFCSQPCPLSAGDDVVTSTAHPPPPTPPPEHHSSSEQGGAEANLWVLKDSGANGVGGIWIVSAQNWQEVAGMLHDEHRYVAQRYVQRMELWRGRKFHLRVYALLRGDGRMYFHQSAFLHVANSDYNISGDSLREGDAQVHITNCCANKDDQEAFAGEICTHLPSDYPSAYGSIRSCLAELARASAPFLCAGDPNRFEFMGCDFILDKDGAAWLLEANCPPGITTATGILAAEELHNTVMRDLISLIVLPALGLEPERAGGWDQCCNGNTDTDTAEAGTSVEESSGGSFSMKRSKESKWLVQSRLRWNLFQRRALKKARNDCI